MNSRLRAVLVVLAVAGLLLPGCTVLTLEQPASPEGRDAQPLPATDTPLPTPTLQLPLDTVQDRAREAVAPSTATPAAEVVSADADAVERLLVSIYERVSPAVVHVEITGPETAFGRSGGAGSGFVLDRDGHIVTNNHVIENAQRIRVIFADNTTFNAQVVGRDPAFDLAVIRVSAPPDLLMPVELGNSDRLQVGQRAIAIGNPFRFDQSMTVGIVSAVGRVVDPGESGDLIPELIQTDAAINPGNSGGPLLDSRGRVIGINTLIFSETGTSTGVGFAVPVNALRRALPALLEGRRLGRPWLGIAGPQELDAALVDELALPSTAGAYVNFVFPGGPADEAGLIGASESADGSLRPGGDLIVAVNGAPVESFDALLRYLQAETRVGQAVRLTVMRGQETKLVTVTLGERPDGP